MCKLFQKDSKLVNIPYFISQDKLEILCRLKTKKQLPINILKSPAATFTLSQTIDAAFFYCSNTAQI